MRLSITMFVVLACGLAQMVATETVDKGDDIFIDDGVKDNVDSVLPSDEYDAYDEYEFYDDEDDWDSDYEDDYSYYYQDEEESGSGENDDEREPSSQSGDVRSTGATGSFNAVKVNVNQVSPVPPEHLPQHGDFGSTEAPGSSNGIVPQSLLQRPIEKMSSVKVEQIILACIIGCCVLIVLIIILVIILISYYKKHDISRRRESAPIYRSRSGYMRAMNTEIV